MAGSLYDAINAFKYSATGQGKATIRGQPSYINRYRQLASRVVDKLWALYSEDEIGREKLDVRGVSRHGISSWGRYDIAVDKHLANLGEVSSVLVHEAVHLLSCQRPYVEQEMLCRTLQVLYYRDLIKGVTITSKQTGKNINVRIHPNSDVLDLAKMDKYYTRGQLVDYVLTFKEYRKSLKADWVKKSILWWGGIRNRWFKTRGYYMRTLAAEGRSANADLILKIMESVPARHATDWGTMWKAATEEGGSVAQIERAWHRAHSNPLLRKRMDAVKRTWGW